MARASRSVHGAWGTKEGLGRRESLYGLLLVAAGIALAALAPGVPERGPGEAALAEEAAEARPTPGVVVAMHLDEPLAADRTIVWTAAFQAAWDALEGQVREQWRLPRLDLGPPAPRGDVAALRDGRLEPKTVDPADLTVVAGPATEETWGKIERASDLGRPAGSPAPQEADLVVFARLKSSVRYAVPFHAETGPLAFGPSKTPVRAYGLEADAEGPEPERMREQVDLHLDPSIQAEPAQRAVVVLKDAEGRRVVVSGRAPKATLRATWDDVARAIRSIPPASFSQVDRLAIPRVSIVAGRSFDSLIGAEVVGMPPGVSRIAVAREDVHLTADEKGADVDAEAVLVAVGATSLDVVFDGPFLLALCAKGGDRPYAVAWVGSADGLSRWGEAVGRALSADEARPFVGAWRLDREGSLDATLARWGRALAAGGGPPHDVASDRKQLRRHFAAMDLSATVAGDGSVTLAGARDGATKEPLRTALRRDGARVLLVLPTEHPRDGREVDEPPGGPSGAGPRGEERWSVRRDGDRLVLSEVGGGVTVVLVRR